MKKILISMGLIIFLASAIYVPAVFAGSNNVSVHDLLEARKGPSPTVDYDKLYNYLKSKGFSKSVIDKVYQKFKYNPAGLRAWLQENVNGSNNKSPNNQGSNSRSGSNKYPGGNSYK